MNRTAFLNEILPTGFGLHTTAAGADSLKVYRGTINNKLKDVALIKRVAREKVKLTGAPIKYFPIDLNSAKTKAALADNALGDQTNVELGPPIGMMATWTPMEYQLDLSKWGVMMPTGTDQQLFIHVDELTEKLHRKPTIGDIIETVNDTMRYRVSDVFYGNANLWENIFCMVTLTKATYDTFTSQLDKYSDPNEASYSDTYSALQNVLNISSTGANTLMPTSNDTILANKASTYAYMEPAKRSIDTQVEAMQDILNTNSATSTTSTTTASSTVAKTTTSTTSSTTKSTGLDLMTMKL